MGLVKSTRGTTKPGVINDSHTPLEQWQSYLQEWAQEITVSWQLAHDCGAHSWSCSDWPVDLSTLQKEFKTHFRVFPKQCLLPLFPLPDIKKYQQKDGEREKKLHLCNFWTCTILWHHADGYAMNVTDGYLFWIQLGTRKGPNSDVLVRAVWEKVIQCLGGFQYFEVWFHSYLKKKSMKGKALGSLMHWQSTWCAIQSHGPQKPQAKGSKLKGYEDWLYPYAGSC